MIITIKHLFAFFRCDAYTIAVAFLIFFLSVFTASVKNRQQLAAFRKNPAESTIPAVLFLTTFLKTFSYNGNMCKTPFYFMFAEREIFPGIFCGYFQKGK